MSQKIATGYRKISLTLKSLFSPCSGFLGFFLMFSTMKLKSLAQGHLTVSGKASVAGQPVWRFSTDRVAKFIPQECNC